MADRASTTSSTWFRRHDVAELLAIGGSGLKIPGDQSRAFAPRVRRAGISRRPTLFTRSPLVTRLRSAARNIRP